MSLFEDKETKVKINNRIHSTSNIERFAHVCLLTLNIELRTLNSFWRLHES
jgi:hypothetical protein